MFEELNNISRQWKIDGKNFPFKKLKEIGEGNSFPIYGLYINKKGNYDAHPVAISKDIKVDLPEHLTEKVEKILESDEMCEAIEAGKCGAEVYKYISNNKKAKGKECYSINFKDL